MGATRPVNSGRTRSFAVVSSACAFLVLLLASGFLAGPPSVPGQGVVNGSAGRDLVGWRAESDAGAVTLSRRSAPSAPSGNSSVVEITAPPASRSWAYCVIRLDHPTEFIEVGHVYRVTLWVRNLSGKRQSVGILLANEAYEHRPTEVAAYASYASDRWHQLRYDFVAERPAAWDTAFYVELPAHGPIRWQITGASLQRVDAVPPHATSDAPDRVLTFEGRAGEAPDPSTWRHDLGGGGWGNQEAQIYTSSRANSRLDGRGGLLITAREVSDAENGRRTYTSARINTRGTFEVSPGSYVEAAIRAPTGKGVWSAFWMLGTDWKEDGWPSSGELDIMEVLGSEPRVARAALHMAALDDDSRHVAFGYRHGVGQTHLDQPTDERANLYGVYFDERMVVIYVNRVPTLRYTAAAAKAAGRAWPFGQDFFLLLNVAVGGLEDPSGTSFPRTMRVGAVKVWSDGIPF
jgi:beta-glucanase (GH16 family)